MDSGAPTVHLSFTKLLSVLAYQASYLFSNVNWKVYSVVAPLLISLSVVEKANVFAQSFTRENLNTKQRNALIKYWCKTNL